MIEPATIFLPHARGIIHIGAHHGQERMLYAEYDLPVVWIEPVPEFYSVLVENLKSFPRQAAFQALITERDDKPHTFHVANQHGMSSSILPMAGHKQLWSAVRYTRDIYVHSVTLPSFLKRKGIGLQRYNVLVVDTQGTEMQVLHGAGGLLNCFNYISIEAGDIEIYEGDYPLVAFDRYLATFGFEQCFCEPIRAKPGVGACFNAVYAKEGNDETE